MALRNQRPLVRTRATTPKAARNGATASKAKGAKYVYNFGAGKADGDGTMKPLLGGKGANLAEMTRIGLPVPPGFTITTEVCTYFYAHKKTYPPELQAQIEAGVRNMEKIMGTKFGDTEKMPLLVAVRSGARDSMPGMMDTILNLGLNDETVKSLAGRDEERALRLGLLPPFHPDVWRRGHGRAEARGRRSRSVRSRRSSTTSTRNTASTTSTTRSSTAADYQELVTRFKKLSKSAPARRSRTIRGISSRARPAPSSARG